MYYKLRYLDRIPEPLTFAQALGTAVHLALENFYLVPPQERIPALLAELFHQAWPKLCEEDPEYTELLATEELRQQFFDRALEIISDYFKLENPQQVNPVALELKINLEPTDSSSDPDQPSSHQQHFRFLRQLITEALRASLRFDNLQQPEELAAAVTREQQQVEQSSLLDHLNVSSPTPPRAPELRRQLLQTLFLHQWEQEAHNRPELDEPEAALLLRKGLKLISIYAHPKKLSLDPTYRGIIDRLELSTENELILTDYKTGSAPNEQYSNSRFFALKVYAWLVTQMASSCALLELWGVDPDLYEVIRNKPISSLRLLYLNGPDEDRLTLPAKIENMGRQLEALWKAINTAHLKYDQLLLDLDDQGIPESQQRSQLTEASRAIFPGKRSKLCDYCFYQQEHCPEWQPPYYQPEPTKSETGNSPNHIVLAPAESDSGTSKHIVFPQ